MNYWNDIVNFVQDNKIMVFVGVIVLVIIMIFCLSSGTQVEGFADLNLINEEEKDLIHILRFELVDRDKLNGSDKMGTGQFLSTVSNYCVPVLNKDINQELENIETGNDAIFNPSNDLILKQYPVELNENTKPTEFEYYTRTIKSKFLDQDFIKNQKESSLSILDADNNFNGYVLSSNDTFSKIRARTIEGTDELILTCDAPSSRIALNISMNEIMKDISDGKSIVSIKASQFIKDEKHKLEFSEKVIAQCCPSNKCPKHLQCTETNSGVQFKRLCLVDIGDDIKPALFKVHKYVNIKLAHPDTENNDVYTTIDHRLIACAKLLIKNKVENEISRSILNALNIDIVSNKNINCSKIDNKKCFCFCGTEKKLDVLKTLTGLTNYKASVDSKECVCVCYVEPVNTSDSNVLEQPDETQITNEPASADLMTGGTANSTGQDVPEPMAVENQEGIETFASINRSTNSDYGYF